MEIFYVIRSGWNAANQSSLGCVRNPANQFESSYYRLVAIVTSDCEESAILKANAHAYNNQNLFAVSNPREIKGLTAEIREFQPDVYAY